MHIYKIFIIILFICLLFLNRNSIAEKSGDEVIIGGDNVLLREKPSLESKVLKKLSLGHMVHVLKKSKNYIYINKLKGRWVFVDSNILNSSPYGNNNDETIKGWVFDYYLYYKYKFKKLTTNKYRKISVTCSGGDIYFEVQFNSDGSFTMKDKYLLGGSDEHEKYCKESFGIYKKSEPNSCYHKGYTYKYNRIIWAKVDIVPDGGNDFYFITDSNQLRYITHGPDYCGTYTLK